MPPKVDKKQSQHISAADAHKEIDILWKSFPAVETNAGIDSIRQKFRSLIYIIINATLCRNLKGDVAGIREGFDRLKGAEGHISKITGQFVGSHHMSQLKKEHPELMDLIPGMMYYLRSARHDGTKGAARKKNKPTILAADLELWFQGIYNQCKEAGELGLNALIIKAIESDQFVKDIREYIGLATKDQKKEQLVKKEEPDEAEADLDESELPTSSKPKKPETLEQILDRAMMADLFGDEEEAINLYKKAIAMGHVQSCYELGLLEYSRKNVIEAIKNFKIAADADYAPAQYAYSQSCIFHSNPKDIISGREYCEKAAKQGYLPAQVFLSTHYSKESTTQERSIYWLRKAAAQKDPESQVNYALFFEVGKGVKQSLKLAKKYFNAAGDYPDALYHLGRHQEKGIGCKINEKQALYFYQKAAKQGSAVAKFKIGAFYNYGVGGLEIDYDMAFKYYNESLPFSINNLANCYMLGRGTKQDLDKALLLFEEIDYIPFEKYDNNYLEIFSNQAVKNINIAQCCFLIYNKNKETSYDAIKFLMRAKFKLDKYNEVSSNIELGSEQQGSVQELSSNINQELEKLKSLESGNPEIYSIKRMYSKEVEYEDELHEINRTISFGKRMGLVMPKDHADSFKEKLNRFSKFILQDEQENQKFQNIVKECLEVLTIDSKSETKKPTTSPLTASTTAVLTSNQSSQR